MVIKYDKQQKNNIKADVIILGCSLPGIVTAHKLKKKFGNTMDIVVLDLAGNACNNSISKCNVVFQDNVDDDAKSVSNPESIADITLGDNASKSHLAKYVKEFNIPLPDIFVSRSNLKSPLLKLFQYRNGKSVSCYNDYNDFEYLNFIERFELNQYQSLLDQCMFDLFKEHDVHSRLDTKRLHYYDQTTMEQHICNALLFPTPRELMRTTVRLVCGANPKDVSVLFYLHQCYRTATSKNHLNGNNTRFREKLLGYCRKRLATKLQQSIADITLTSKPIKEIRTYSDEFVILETMIGETNYICNLLAMALRPDQLHSIRVESQLLSEREFSIATAMIPGRAKKFVIQYEDNFWSKHGLSGDILSLRGPIIWAMERPQSSTTGSTEKHSSLIGYLKVKESDPTSSSKDAVVEQLVKMYGQEAAEPVNYKETMIPDVFVPRCGDYLALRRLTSEASSRYLVWGALDIFADGDIAAAIEAGHTTYIRLLSCLRPQAQSFEDFITEWVPRWRCSPFVYWMTHINLVLSLRLAAFSTAVYVFVSVAKNYLRK